MQNYDLLIVIPVFNEGSRLKSLISDWSNELHRLKIDCLICIYNDASTDDTALQLNHLAQEYPQVQVVHAAVNRGHGPVLYQAYSEAAAAQWVFQIDGDHELACDAFERLWTERQNFDILLGSRTGVHTNVFRKMITYTARQMVGLLFGAAVSDVNCPYRLMRNSFLQPALQRIRPDTFAPNVLLVALAIVGQYRIYSTPVSVTGLTKFQRRWQPPWRMLQGSIRAGADLLRIRYFTA